MAIENIQLTKNAKKVFKKSYKLYLSRKKLGHNNPDYIIFMDLPKIPRKDFLSAADEICDNNLAKRYKNAFKFNTNATLYMENKLKNKILKTLKFIFNK